MKPIFEVDKQLSSSNSPMSKILEKDETTPHTNDPANNTKN